MPNKTSIEWTDFSSQLIRYRDNDTGKDVWACAKTSPGCAHCYSEAIAQRFDRGGPFTKEQMKTVTPYFAREEADKILKSRKISGKKIFVGDMTDMFGDWVPDHLLLECWLTFAQRQDVTFQILTKRAERLPDFLSKWQDTGPEDAPPIMSRDGVTYREYGKTREQAESVLQSGRSKMFYAMTKSWGEPPDGGVPPTYDWMEGPRWLPGILPNVWLGVSVEDQQRADERIPHLLKTPAAIRFLSCEPLLGEVDLRFPASDPDCPSPESCCPECGGDVAAEGDGWRCVEHSGIHIGCGWKCDYENEGTDGPDVRPQINWVIIGGESGPKARPCNLAWIRSLVKQCQEAGVAAFVKQIGSKPYDSDAMKKVPGADKVYYSEAEAKTPEALECLQACLEASEVYISDPKGGLMEEWPADLRIRQMPEVPRG